MPPTPRTLYQVNITSFLLVVSLSGACQRETNQTKPNSNSNGANPAPQGQNSLPGAPAFSAELLAKLDHARKALGPDYVARTKHKDNSGKPLYTNRLITTSSPYLHQHAHNPVNWYPWGDEAFKEAARRGVPVLVSIGYSTCHWCHVMEEESFEDIEIARYLNENFIAIKVDREERPDIDAIYQNANRVMRRAGGWPLNVWLTPERKPFFGGTYFPPRTGVRGSRIGLIEILGRIKEQFDSNHDELLKSADMVASMVASISAPGAETAGTQLPDSSVIASLVRTLVANLDPVYGGLRGSGGNRSKFPSSFPNRLLLRYASRLGPKANKEAQKIRSAVALTLDRMAAGGIYDQVGGGFHRYSVDRDWSVPHFEKMLYDNARLIVTYLEGYQALGNKDYAGIAVDTIAYLVREMRTRDGGFYSATDADSMNEMGHREEGAFFAWTAAGIDSALSSKDAELVKSMWGVTSGGNFEGMNVLHLAKKMTQLQASKLSKIRDLLYEIRKHRAPPLRDDKVLAAWNGLMLSALARAAAVLPKEFVPPAPARGRGLNFLALATETATFITTQMIVDGRLHRVYRDGRSYGVAFAEDYAFVIAGLIELFEASGAPQWLEQALALQKTLDRYHLSKSGAYYTTANDAEVLLTREIPKRDGAVASANSVAALNLLRLYELTSVPTYLEAADKLLGSFRSQLESSPSSLTEMLIALDFRTQVVVEIVLAATEKSGSASFGELESALRSTFTPRAVVVRKGPQPSPALDTVVPLSAEKSALGGVPTAYVCRLSSCQLPTNDPNVFKKQLREASRPKPDGQKSTGR